MKTYCLFRESVNSPLFESNYDYGTGLIDGIDESKFKCKLGYDFNGKFPFPPNFIVPVEKCNYVYAINAMNGLVAFKHNNIGIVVLSTNDMFFYSIELDKFYRYRDQMLAGYNVFNYPKICIGVYKTVVRQLDVPERSCSLYTDTNGDYLMPGKVISTGVTKDAGDDIKNIKRIKLFKEGYSGCYIDNDGHEHPFK